MCQRVWRTPIKRTVELVKAASLPLIVFCISLGIFVLTHMFLAPRSPSFASILDSIMEGLMSGAVFYFFTVTIPSNRQKRIAKEYAIFRYEEVKKTMLVTLLLFLRKKPNNTIVNQAIRDYRPIRDYVNDDLCAVVNNLTKDLVKESLYHLSQLKEVLNTLLAYDFIKDNSLLCHRIQHLNYWINQFHYYYDAYYTENDDRDFAKRFVGFINEFLLGVSSSTGPREKDDFIDLLENA